MQEFESERDHISLHMIQCAVSAWVRHTAAGADAALALYGESRMEYTGWREE